MIDRMKWSLSSINCMRRCLYSSSRTGKMSVLDAYRAMSLPLPNGLKPNNVTPEQVKKQYRELLLTYHPDHNKLKLPAAECADRFRLIREAFNIVLEHSTNPGPAVQQQATNAAFGNQRKSPSGVNNPYYQKGEGSPDARYADFVRRNSFYDSTSSSNDQTGKEGGNPRPMDDYMDLLRQMKKHNDAKRNNTSNKEDGDEFTFNSGVGKKASPFAKEKTENGKKRYAYQTEYYNGPTIDGNYQRRRRTEDMTAEEKTESESNHMQAFIGKAIHAFLLVIFSVISYKVYRTWKETGRFIPSVTANRADEDEALESEAEEFRRELIGVNYIKDYIDKRANRMVEEDRAKIKKILQQ